MKTKTRNRLAVWAALLLPALGPATGAEEYYGEAWEACCAKHRYLAKIWSAENEGGTSARKFAPDRLIDVSHVKIDITPDFERRSISGVAELTFSPIAKPLGSVSFDAVDLEITSVEGSVGIGDFTAGSEQLQIVFEEEVAAGEEVTVKVVYSASPEDGLFFRTPEMGYPEGDTQLWTQGEPERHRHWFPGYDYPNERFTTEVICRVPEGMVAVSNGHLVGEPEKDADTGLVAHHWLQDKEHVNYLVTVVAGYFSKIEGKYGELPIAIYVPPSERDQAANSFRDTEKILAFFEKEIGVKFPWDKYYNMCVHDFIAGGMENTSATTLSLSTLFTADTEQIYSSHRLDAHEVAHQWFGDLVTCKDWSHLWLNEGFATYYTELYENERSGRDQMLYGMLRNAQRVLNAGKFELPIEWREYKSPGEQFDFRAYPKGAWVLHMLRCQLGPDLYRECVRRYLEENRNRSVVGEDLNRVIEKTSGRSFDRFFEQWVKRGGYPKLSVKYAWDGDRNQAKLTLKQTQEVNASVPLFHFPLPVRIHGKDGVVTERELVVTRESEEFYIVLDSAPELVRIDPDLTVLADISFDPPKAMLEEQITREEDMLGRLLAVRKLAEKDDVASAEKVGQRLREDPFYGVRIEAAIALEKMHTDAAMEQLLAAGEQPDARVRLQVVQSLGKFFRNEAEAKLREVVENEPNPAVAAAAVGALGRFPGDGIEEVLASQLERHTYKNRIARAAIDAIKTRGDTKMVDVLVDYLGKNRDRYDWRELAGALGAVGTLAGHGTNGEKDVARVFLTEQLADPRRRVRSAAIGALGVLGDPKSIGAIETFLADPESSEGKAAREAIERLSAQKPTPQEVRDLREEVLRIREEMREMAEELERLKKQTTP